MSPNINNGWERERDTEPLIGEAMKIAADSMPFKELVLLRAFHSLDNEKNLQKKKEKKKD